MDEHRVGRFVVERRLGAGGFATVWQAWDPELESRVAVKVLADNWAGDADVRRRFTEEARLLRRVDSDHVVRVYDIGALDDGRPYFVMTYADLGTLNERLAAVPPPWTPQAVVAVVDAVADGLEVLHRHGVVHRDVKPANLLLRTVAGGAEALLLGDLGIAKDLTWASGITQPMGTDGYRSPEQSWYSAEIGPASDVFALAQVARVLLGLAAPPWPPGPLGATLARGTAHEAQERTGSAAEFARQFRAAVADLGRPTGPVAIPAPPPPEPATVQLAPQPVTVPDAGRRRSAGRQVALGSVALLVVAAAAAGWALTQRTTRISSPDGRVSVTLPSGWDAAGTAAVPGETVGEGMRATRDDRTVEAAMARSAAGPATVVARTGHPGCGSVSGSTVTAGAWRGVGLRWSGCPGDAVVHEVALRRPDGSDVLVWVRVRSVDGVPELADVLSGLRVGD